MCNYSNTHYTQCGCTVSEQTERCGYHDDDFSACMKYTDIKDLEPRNGRCGRATCKHRELEPVNSLMEWRLYGLLLGEG